MMRIGIDLGGTKIEGALMDAAGELLVRQRVPTPGDSYRGIVTAIAELVAMLEQQAGQAARVGVAHPGAISTAGGRMKNSNSTVLNGQPLADDLRNVLAREVRLANDADCFALSEATDGAGAGASSVFGVIVGTGTGAGIVVQGRLLRGPNAIAGEWGHNPLPWPTVDELPGPDCYCGRQGCIETYLSGPGLLADYRAANADGAKGNGRSAIGPKRAGPQPAAARCGPAHRLAMITPVTRVEEIVRRAEAGEVDAERCLARYHERMARALAHVVNLLDPTVIVLGGGLSNLDSLYREVPRHWGPYIFSDTVHTQLLAPRHGDSSGVRGAAWLWPPEGP